MRSHGGVIAQLTELIAQLPDDTDAEMLVGLRRVIEQAEAKSCRQIRSFDARQGYAATDPSAVNMTSWLRHYCHLAPGDASRRVRIARTLPHLPHTQAAFDTGDIGVQHADNLALLVRQTSIEAVQQLEPILLELRRASHAGNLKVACDKARHCADPDGALKAANRAHEHRYLRVCSGFNGMVLLDGQLDPAAGAAVQATLDA